MFKGDINKEARRIAKEISDHFDDYVTKYKNIAKQIFEDGNESKYSNDIKNIYHLHDKEVEIVKLFLVSSDPRELDLFERVESFWGFSATIDDVYKLMDDCISNIQQKKKELKKLEKSKNSRIKGFRRVERYAGDDDSYYYGVKAYGSKFLEDKELSDREKKSFYAKLVSIEFNKLDLSYATEYKQRNKLNYFTEHTIDCNTLKLFVEGGITYEALMTLTYRTSC